MADLGRRRRAVAATLAVLVVAATAWLATRSHSGAGRGDPSRGDASRGGAASGKAGPSRSTAPQPSHEAAPSLAAAESGLLPWHMAAPLSREVAAAAAPGRLLVFGGLTAGGKSADHVYTVGMSTGTVRPAGPLTAALHDAAAAARGGGASVSVGGATYLVGGSGGSGPGWVLATADGHGDSKVAALPVPVRYPAVAALGGRIYAFGGQAVSGPHAGAPVSVIQAIDPARRTAAVVGDLPEPLAGAAAVTVGGELFVAGGESTAQTVSTIWAYDPRAGRLLPAGRLQVPVSHAAVTAAGSTAWIVGGESNGALVSSVQMIRPDRAFGAAGAPGAGSPFFGARLLIADRANNRMLLLDSSSRVVWQYPSPGGPTFYYPDDAFFTDHGTAIISNQEENETIVKIAYPSGKIIWSYGHQRQPGTARGYLHEPDDAYLLKNGQVTVADAMNCRVLVINANHTVARQIGTDGVCAHNPPYSMGSPNGDTPLADGNLLVSEINGSWVSEYTPKGKLVWTVQLPIGYPSDPQQIGPDKYLLADYSAPGQFLEFTHRGKILYRYAPASGPGMLNHPSLVELLPSGVLMANDDYNDRMVAVDPATGALVWQYGVTGRPGTAPGLLNIPDGFDLLLPDGSAPTHPATG